MSAAIALILALSQPAYRVEPIVDFLAGCLAEDGTVFGWTKDGRSAMWSHGKVTLFEAKETRIWEYDNWTVTHDQSIAKTFVAQSAQSRDYVAGGVGLKEKAPYTYAVYSKGILYVIKTLEGENDARDKHFSICCANGKCYAYKLVFDASKCAFEILEPSYLGRQFDVLPDGTVYALEFNGQVSRWSPKEDLKEPGKPLYKVSETAMYAADCLTASQDGTLFLFDLAVKRGREFDPVTYKHKSGYSGPILVANHHGDFLAGLIASFDGRRASLTKLCPELDVIGAEHILRPREMNMRREILINDGRDSREKPDSPWGPAPDALLVPNR